MVEEFIRNGILRKYSDIKKEKDTETEKLFNEYRNVKGGLAITTNSKEEAKEKVTEYLLKRVENRNTTFSIFIEGYFNIRETQEIENAAKEAILKKFPGVMKDDKISMFLMTKTAPNNTAYSYYRGTLAYVDGQNAKKNYTVHFIDRYTGQEVGTDKGIAEVTKETAIKFPENYIISSDPNKRYTVNSGTASYNSKTGLTIKVKHDVDMTMYVQRSDKVWTKFLYLEKDTEKELRKPTEGYFTHGEIFTPEPIEGYVLEKPDQEIKVQKYSRTIYYVKADATYTIEYRDLITDQVLKTVKGIGASGQKIDFPELGMENYAARPYSSGVSVLKAGENLICLKYNPLYNIKVEYIEETTGKMLATKSFRVEARTYVSYDKTYTELEGYSFLNKCEADDGSTSGNADREGKVFRLFYVDSNNVEFTFEGLELGTNEVLFSETRSGKFNEDLTIEVPKLEGYEPYVDLYHQSQAEEYKRVRSINLSQPGLTLCIYYEKAETETGVVKTAAAQPAKTAALKSAPLRAAKPETVKQESAVTGEELEAENLEHEDVETESVETEIRRSTNSNATRN